VFQHQREEAADGSYRVSAWDDRQGHATIWEYDANDQLTALGVVVHWAQERWDGDVAGEAIWYDAAGRETRRSEVRRT
jgi:YD repeat-containing protein